MKFIRQAPSSLSHSSLPSTLKNGVAATNSISGRNRNTIRHSSSSKPVYSSFTKLPPGFDFSPPKPIGFYAAFAPPPPSASDETATSNKSEAETQGSTNGRSGPGQSASRARARAKRREIQDRIDGENLKVRKPVGGGVSGAPTTTIGKARTTGEGDEFTTESFEDVIRKARSLFGIGPGGVGGTPRPVGSGMKGLAKDGAAKIGDQPVVGSDEVPGTSPGAKPLVQEILDTPSSNISQETSTSTRPSSPSPEPSHPLSFFSISQSEPHSNLLPHPSDRSLQSLLSKIYNHSSSSVSSDSSIEPTKPLEYESYPSPERKVNTDTSEGKIDRITQTGESDDRIRTGLVEVWGSAIINAAKEEEENELMVSKSMGFVIGGNEESERPERWLLISTVPLEAMAPHLSPSAPSSFFISPVSLPSGSSPSSSSLPSPSSPIPLPLSSLPLTSHNSLPSLPASSLALIPLHTSEPSSQQHQQQPEWNNTSSNHHPTSSGNSMKLLDSLRSLPMNPYPLSIGSEVTIPVPVSTGQNTNANGQIGLRAKEAQEAESLSLDDPPSEELGDFFNEDTNATTTGITWIRAKIDGYFSPSGLATEPGHYTPLGSFLLSPFNAPTSIDDPTLSSPQAAKAAFVDTLPSICIGAPILEPKSGSVVGVVAPVKGENKRQMGRSGEEVDGREWGRGIVGERVFEMFPLPNFVPASQKIRERERIEQERREREREESQQE